MNNLPVYILDRDKNHDDIARFVPDGDDTEVGNALIASGHFDEIPTVLFKFPAALVLVLRDDPNEFRTNLNADDLQEDAEA